MKLTMIIEWSKGTRERYDWQNGVLVTRDLWPEEWGLPPVNYGLIPGIHNPADDAEVDAICFGELLPAGTKYRGDLIGMVWLSDGDHKLVISKDGLLPSESQIQDLLAWFEGRSPRLTQSKEAERFVLGLIQAKK